MRITPLKEINEFRKFWRGTILRNFNGDDPEHSQDYMLIQAMWEKSMMLVNITFQGNKKGLVYGGVIPVDDTDFAVTKSGFKHAFGDDLEGWFLIEDEPGNKTSEN